MPVRTPRLTLREMIDKSRESNNGFGYDEFIKLMQLPKRPSYRSMTLMFNKNYLTIKKWVERWEEEGK